MSKTRSMPLPSMTASFVPRWRCLVPMSPFVPHQQRGGHVEVTREGSVLARARPGELVALTGAQQDRRRDAAGVGGNHRLA